jgi:hypothetical protein
MYAPHERLIFGPFDRGDGRATYADPIRAYRRLCAALGGEPNKWITKSNEGDNAAREKVIDAAGWALEMVPFDKETGQGATEGLVYTNLRAFLGFVLGNWPRAASLPTSARPTGGSTEVGPASPNTSSSG